MKSSNSAKLQGGRNEKKTCLAHDLCNDVIIHAVHRGSRNCSCFCGGGAGITGIEEVTEVAENTESVQEEEPVFVEEDESFVFITGEGELGSTSVRFEYDGTNKSFSVADMNNNEVDIYRILDNLIIRQAGDGKSITDVLIATGSNYFINRGNPEQENDKGAWKINCGDGKSTDGELKVTYGGTEYTISIKPDIVDTSWRAGFFDGDARLTEIDLKSGISRDLRIEINHDVVKNQVLSYSVQVIDYKGTAPVFVVGDQEKSLIDHADWQDSENRIIIKSTSNEYAKIEVTLYGGNAEGDEGHAWLEINKNTPPYRLSAGGSEGSVTKPVDNRFTVDLFGNTDKVTEIVWSLPDRNTASFVDDDGLIEQTSITYEKGESGIRNNIDLKGLKEGTVDLHAEITDDLGTIGAEITITFTQNSGDTWRVGFFDGDIQFTSISLKNGETRSLRIEKNNSVVTNEITSYSVRVTDPQGSDAAPVFIVNNTEGASINRAVWKSNDNWITIKSKSDGFAHIEVTLYGTNTEGDEGCAALELNVGGGGEIPYNGEIHWSYVTNDLHFELEGWTEELQREYGDPFTKTLIGSGKGAYWSIELDVSDDAWRAVYNNADLADGISLSVYPDVPNDNSIIGYMIASNEVYPENQLENHLRTIMNHNAMEFQDGTRELKHKAGCTVAEVVSVGGRRVLNLKESNRVDEHYSAWYTRLNPKETYFYPDGENVHIAKFTISQKGGERSLYVDDGSKLKASWLTFDTEGIFSGTELKSTALSDRIVRYVLDGDALGLNGYQKYTLDNNHLAYYTTKLSIPDVDPGSVTVTCAGKNQDGIVDAGDPKNILFKTPFVTRDRFLSDRDYIYKVVYSIGGVSYTEYLTFRTTIEYKDCLLKYYGYKPVPESRVFFNSTLTDAQSNGFAVEYISDGQIATIWNSNYINIAGMKADFYVLAPSPDGKEVKAYKIFRHTSYSGMNPREVVDINMDGTAWAEYKDRAESEYGWLPTAHEVSGYPFYSLNQPITDDQEWYVINWLCDDDSIIEEYLYVVPDREYPYESADKHTKITLPEEIHAAGGDPEPRLYAIYDSKGVERKDTGYSLKVEYFGKDASYENGDYDYYRITLVDANGDPADLRQGFVELIFSYPNGKTRTEMKNMNFVLAHYQDETHESSAKEKLSFEEDGIHVTLDHLSPFLMVWNEQEEEPEEAPALTGLEIAEAPKKTVYTAGESFDPTGMEILAVYSDRQRKTVTGFTVKPSGKLSVSDTSVEISYTENGVTKTVTQKITVRAASSPSPVHSYTGSRSERTASPIFTGTWNNAVSNGSWTQDAAGVWHYTTSQSFRNTWGYIVNPYARDGQHTADWFWFDANGNMLTGWQFINGKWYYLNPTKDGTLGACWLGGVTPDGWTVDANGAWIESIPQKKS